MLKKVTVVEFERTEGTPYTTPKITKISKEFKMLLNDVHIKKINLVKWKKEKLFKVSFIGDEEIIFTRPFKV